MKSTKISEVNSQISNFRFAFTLLGVFSSSLLLFLLVCNTFLWVETGRNRESWKHSFDFRKYWFHQLLWLDSAVVFGVEVCGLLGKFYFINSFDWPGLKTKSNVIKPRETE